MRKLVVEFPKTELGKVEGDSPFLQNLKTLEVLMYLKYSNEEITMICRVELDFEVSNIEEYAKLVGENIYGVQLLERETGGAYIVLVKHKLQHVDEKRHTNSQILLENGGYIVSREMWEGKFRITFLGSVHQIKETLKTLESFFD